MKPLPTDSSTRPEILRAVYIYGLWFGIALGFAFAIATWGVDAYILGTSHGLYPWLKLMAGAIPCMILGGLTGWISAKMDKSILAILFWLISASLFAWLTVSVPFQIAPRILNIVGSGLQGLLHYKYYDSFSSRIGIAYAWIAIFVSITGLLQIPLSESAVFSTNFLGKMSPVLVCFILMGLCGTIVDGLNNEPLRSATTSLNDTLQFSISHEGQAIDPAESRRMHLGSLRTIQDMITPEYKLLVGGFNEDLGEIDVLVKFENGWSECQVFYNQPTNCKKVGEKP